MPDVRAPAMPRRKAKAIHVNKRYCSGCGICIQFCPHHVLEYSSEISTRGVYAATVAKLEACTVCRLCELYCGSFAIAVEEGKEGSDG